jgi:hypothetical protein
MSTVLALAEANVHVDFLKPAPMDADIDGLAETNIDGLSSC